MLYDTVDISTRTNVLIEHALCAIPRTPLLASNGDILYIRVAASLVAKKKMSVTICQRFLKNENS